MSDILLQANQLTKQFGSTAVLRGVDLTIPRGAVVGLVGTNGAGKSTLIKCLLGILKRTSGTSSLFGEDSWTLSDAAKQRLGYVPQEFKLYPWMRVRQVVSYTATFYQRWDDRWANELIDRWELPREHRLGPLSAGQLQKLALVLALGHRPELLLLDEPVASLDPLARREFLRSLMELTADESRSVLFSTHITSDLERAASHVALLKEGRVLLFDEIDALKEKVKRVLINSLHDLPRSFAVAGALRTRVEGRTALLAMPSVSEETLNELRSQWQAEVTVEDLNLEEIFLELHSR